MSTGAGSRLGAVGLANFTSSSATPSVALSEMKYPGVWRSSSPTDVSFSKRKRSLAQAAMRVHELEGCGEPRGPALSWKSLVLWPGNRGADTERRESGEGDGDDTVQEIGCGTQRRGQRRPP